MCNYKPSQAYQVRSTVSWRATLAKEEVLKEEIEEQKRSRLETERIERRNNRNTGLNEVIKKYQINMLLSSLFDPCGSWKTKAGPFVKRPWL